MPFLHKRLQKKSKIEPTSKRCFVSKKLKSTNDTILWYDGNIVNGKRNNFGTLRKLTTDDKDGRFHRIYIGNWKENYRHGEGCCYFANDNIFIGHWERNQINGIGIMWYNPNNVNKFLMYMGEWKSNRFHGIGILWETNLNRYEGSFKRGQKYGEGTYYHYKSGQMQKGMWKDNICVTSMIVDGDHRQYCLEPSKYPITECKLQDIKSTIHSSFRKYMMDTKDICSCCSLDSITSCYDIFQKYRNIHKIKSIK